MLDVPRHRALARFAVSASLVGCILAACGGEDRDKGQLPDAGPIGPTSTGTAGSGGDGASGGGGSGADGGAGGGNACANMTKDGAETDVDCGGGTCPGCNDGLICVTGIDCNSEVCANGVCVPPACPDGVENGNETDLDCGGIGCPRCAEGQGCKVDEDCVTLSCEAMVCAAPTCMDAAANGQETDVDCGGTTCGPCADGKNCIVPSDCQSGLCNGGLCLLATCGNLVKDGSETDTDCGGAACQPCADFLLCNVNADCQSKKCTNGACAPPACNDQILNGSETDVDCGGQCSGCADGDMCAVADDCQSGVCMGMTCAVPSCVDTVKNGDETAVDCGGSCPKCGLGQTCTAAADCVSDVCNAMSKTCDCPTKMVKVTQLGQGAYCVDATEVTYQEYNVFVTANPVNQLAECAWNQTYVPLANWPPTVGKLRFPVTNVDWCDAYNYCAYFGKHLCGKVGGGANSLNDFTNAASSEWYNACSANGVNQYPYGAMYVPLTCEDDGASATVEVQDMQGKPPLTETCIGGFVGLTHMSGNVREWENSCDAAIGQNDQCRLRGGGFGSQAPAVACNADLLMPRGSAASPDGDNIGFRCCL